MNLVRKIGYHLWDNKTDWISTQELRKHFRENDSNLSDPEGCWKSLAQVDCGVLETRFKEDAFADDDPHPMQLSKGLFTEFLACEHIVSQIKDGTDETLESYLFEPRNYEEQWRSPVMAMIAAELDHSSFDQSNVH